MSNKPRGKAWLPVDYDARVVMSLKALAQGEAGPEEQKRAVNWIIEQAAGTYELSFRSDADGGERETAFAEGRRFVGLQMVKLINMRGALVEKLRKADGGSE